MVALETWFIVRTDNRVWLSVSVIRDKITNRKLRGESSEKEKSPHLKMGKPLTALHRARCLRLRRRLVRLNRCGERLRLGLKLSSEIAQRLQLRCGSSVCDCLLNCRLNHSGHAVNKRRCAIYDAFGICDFLGECCDLICSTRHFVSFYLVVAVILHFARRAHPVNLELYLINHVRPLPNREAG